MKTNNKANSKNYSKQKQKLEIKSNYYILPLIIISSIIPLIMRLHVYKPNLKQFIWFWDMDTYSDFFLYYKQFSLICITFIMLITTIYLYIKKKLKFNLYAPLVPIFIYIILCLLSTILSKYSTYGFRGTYEQFESVFALVSYVIIVFYAYSFIKSENDLQYFFKYFLVGVLVLGLVGLTQFLGHDILMTDFGKKLYIPSKYWNSLDTFTLSFPLKTTYLTMYNPNYAGVYTALIIPILIVFLLTCKNIKSAILYSLGLVVMLLSLYGTGSQAGELSILLCTFIIFLFFRNYSYKHKKAILSVLGVIIIFLISISVLRFDSLKATITNVLSIKSTHYALTDIKTNDNLTLTYNRNNLVIKSYLDSGSIYTELNDQNNTAVSYNMDSTTGKITINDERFKTITITPVKYQEVLCLDVNIDNKDWYFSNQLGDNTFYYLTPMNRFDKIIKAKSAIFTGYENIVSGRGYIWSRTLPLLKNSIFLGSGADSFVFVFPHQDYLYNYLAGFEGALLTKPHSMYLQIGVQTGLLSLIAFLTFYAIYSINCFRLFWRSKFTRYYEKVGLAIFVGTISYMITGLTNDSSITVAPVFWVLIGIGTAINHILLTEKMQSKIKNQ